MPGIYGKVSLSWEGVGDENCGLFALARGKYQEALNWFNEAIIKSPTNYYFYEGRALAYARLGDFSSAIFDINKYLIYYLKDGFSGLKGNESILFAKSYCHAEANQLDLALETIDKYLQRMQFDKRAQYMCAIIKCRLGLLDDALEMVNFALGVQPGDFSFLYLTSERPNAIKLRENIKLILAGESHFVEDDLKINFHSYFFLDLKFRISSEYYRRRDMDNLTSENSEYGSYSGLNERTCSRCQMAPCHCSDPDFN